MITRSIIIFLVLLSFNAWAEEKEVKRPFCKTVDEAAKWVLGEVPEKTTMQVARTPKVGLGYLHFGLGMWIRNNVPVWGNRKLMESVGKGIHPDNVGGMILVKYWQLSRGELPEQERKRIEYFEMSVEKIWGTKPRKRTHQGVIDELNKQIQKSWPKDAPYQPFTLMADMETEFNWEPKNMSSNLKENIEMFLTSRGSLPFYEESNLRVGKRDAE
ncbi:MAG: hypothetical protein QM496_08110 [Verrucomicrobiota bacterium]